MITELKEKNICEFLRVLREKIPITCRFVQMSNESRMKLNCFAADVLQGLSAERKFLSSKYFYDDYGSSLFRQIMELPEYYLTRTETEIFERRKTEIIEKFTSIHPTFDLIELGAGDGTKTAILIETLLKKGVLFNYFPIDISAEALAVLTEKFKQDFPHLSMKPIHNEYLEGLNLLKTESKRAKIVFFLGSNIGNFTLPGGIEFLKQIKSAVNKNDLLLIGFDLQKDPQIILPAYDDAQGVTAAFNLNLLTRINRELGANFEIDKFLHQAVYDKFDGAARSFLVSRVQQTVFIKALNAAFHFQKGEPIFMEVSQKYSFAMIEELAETSGFEVAQNFLDEKSYFTDSLWKSL